MHDRNWLCVKVWLHCHFITLVWYRSEKYWGHGKVLIFFVRHYLVSSELPVHCHNCCYYNYYHLVNFFRVTNKLLYPDLQLWLGMLLCFHFACLLLNVWVCCFYFMHNMIQFADISAWSRTDCWSIKLWQFYSILFIYSASICDVIFCVLHPCI